MTASSSEMPPSSSSSSIPNGNRNVTSDIDVDQMSVALLKSELISRNDPSFVFNDRHELESALRSARLSAEGEEKKSVNLVNDGKGRYETINGLHDQLLTEDIPIPLPPRKESNSDLSLLSSVIHGNDEDGNEGDEESQSSIISHHSRRLVEYFVMVSCVPSKANNTSSDNMKRFTRRLPPDPSRDKMNSRTLGRFKVRKAHLSHSIPSVQFDDQNHADKDNQQKKSPKLTLNDSEAQVVICSDEIKLTEKSGKDETDSTASTVEEESDNDEKEYGAKSDTLKPSLPLVPNATSTNSTANLEKTIDSQNDNESSNDTFMENYLLEPVISARYPLADHTNHSLNPRLPQFCHPDNANHYIYPTRNYKMPRVHHFVLTDNGGTRQYGTCLTVYEEFHLEGRDKRIVEEDSRKSRSSSTSTTYYAPRVLCLLSTYPYLAAFRTYLTQLYRLATATNVMTAPIERYIQNICSEVPAPPPGAFEVHLNIMNTSVRFWAPPADQPIAYVSLPFQSLFECLDIGNVLYVWYTLACERKVLLVSSQWSLLTVCAEIFISLLFPFKWSHFYIPLLPHSLSPMLDAPMPYLCGISRENFPYAVADISDETIVVDLDRNVITLGPNTPELPPLPHKRRIKLEQALQSNVGHVYWEARNLSKTTLLQVRSTGTEQELATLLQTANAAWEERIRSRDDAFSLAYLPDSTNLDFHEDTNNSNNGKQSCWDAVQEAFLRFYVAMLMDYRKFLPVGNGGAGDGTNLKMRSSWRGKEGVSDLRFRTEEFIQASSSDFRPFLEELVMTQQFDDFVTKRMYNAEDAPDVTFFDQSIDAKRNRSRRKLKKVDTPFLHSASAHRDLKRVQAIEPDCEGLPLSVPNREKNFYYKYETWPVTFDESLFGTPRPIPEIIGAEFDRRSILRTMLRSKHGVVDDSEENGCHNASPECTAFILFFVTFTRIIGKEQYNVRKKHRKGGSHRSSTDRSDDMEVARTIAKAQIDLGYHTLSLMRMRRLPPEPMIYKLLIRACGRCGVTHRASELMVMVARDGLASNSEVYTSLISAFSGGRDSGPTDLALRHSDNVSDVSSSRGGSTAPLAEVSSEHGSTTSDGTHFDSIKTSRSRIRNVMTSSFTGGKNLFRKNQVKKNMSSPALTKKKNLRVNVAIGKQIDLSESLMESLYPDLTLDTDSDACPKCATTLAEDNIIMGWTPCANKNYQTECPSCKFKFVPKFSVTCSSSSFDGSQGKGTALYCDFLSPWVLLSEIQGVMAKNGIDFILQEKFRTGTDINTTLWWNMIVTLRRYRLPYLYLLQGSFKNQLILPSPSLNTSLTDIMG